MAGRNVQGESRVLAAMRQTPADFEREMVGELDASAQLLARRMTARVRRFRSFLGNSVHVRSPEPLVREIGPGMEYALPQEEGVKAGGKGLPKFSDPAAADIVAWLRFRAFSGQRSARRNSMAAVRQDLELRDRYEGLAWHIRHKGVKPGPFVKPAFDELAPAIEQRLRAAGERALQRAGSAA
ncbi:MAG TPA: hypothetical protein VD932_08645 [Aquabacterium sp.]|nr:hypothetical protein [Aquabacterium sp.]